MTEEIHAFPLGVEEKLKTYVYRLIDPRNGETFYVGKGQGDRVFAHIREQVEEDNPNNKLRADRRHPSGRFRGCSRHPPPWDGRQYGP